MTRFQRLAFSASLLLTLISGCAADRLHREGLSAIDRGDYEAGVAALGQAVAKDPGNMSYRLDLQARRERAVQKLVADADGARAAGQYDAAAALYRRVLAIDVGNDRAVHGLAALDSDREHGAELAAARNDFERKDFDAAEEKVRAILNENPGYKPAQELAGAINIARGPTTVAPRLQTRDNRKVTLQFRDAPTKMVFEVLQRETGINFVLDKDVKGDGKTTIFVQDVPVDQALDLVLDQNQLARQILASNMVMIYPNNPNKQKEYEQQIVRTFYVTNADPKDVESMLKAVLGAKNMYIDERASAVILRDTPDAVRMAEKLVASLDVAEPEVMLEVEVLEMSSSKLQDLGILYPTTATLAPTPVGTAAASVGSSMALSDLAHQNSHTVSVTPLSVTLNAMKTAGVVNTLASPRIRARNKEKAKVLIGSRLPVITSGVTSIGASSATTLTSNVQYLDVGLTLEVQPTVHLDSDVAIKINLEVSSVLKQVTIPSSNTIAYEIGTRNANTLLRLKDGETQILAGLIQDSDTRNANTVPGLGDIPLLGRLFGTHHSDREKDEIVLSITPRIIRMQPRPSNETTEFWYGNESRTRTGPYTAAGGPESSSRNAAAGPGGSRPETYFPSVAPAPNPVGPQPVNPSVPASEVSAPLGGSAASPPQTSNKSMAVPAPTGLATRTVPVAIAPASEPAAASSSQSAADSDAAGGGGDAGTRTAPARSALSLDGPSQAKVGEEFEVTLQLSSEQGITRLRSQLRFDSTALQLVSANTGDVIPAAAGGPNIDSKGGGAQLEVVTSPDDPVQGKGSLMVLRFKALAPRPATNIAAMVNVLGGTGAAVGSTSAQPLKLTIQQ